MRADSAFLERILLAAATVFLGLNLAALCLAPSVVEGRWIFPTALPMAAAVYSGWCVAAWLLHIHINRHLPGRDPVLFPAAALLAGWGILLLARLAPAYAIRQTLWFAAGCVCIFLFARKASALRWMFRYRYLWILLSLTALVLTFWLGYGPQADSPHLWLGIGLISLQPSEPAKLAFIVFTAAVVQMSAGRSKRLQGRALLLTCGAYILFVSLLALQGDYGTALIFSLVAAALIFLITDRKRYLALSALGLLAAGVGGYVASATVRARVDTWWNPWLDASNTSYQVVQSLIAFASGGLIGRGPGLGYPTLVPVAHSDFIFAAVGEEYGLLGSVGCLIVMTLLAVRGFRAALLARAPGARLLAAGVSFLNGAQALVILGGVLRLLPLTGITLPWMSYGGSSMLVSALGLAWLLMVSQSAAPPAAPAFPRESPVRWLSAGILVSMLGVSVSLGWWGVIRSPVLRTRTDNFRRAILELRVRRGDLLDRDGTPLAETVGTPGSYARRYAGYDFASVTGYLSLRYGESGSEAALDDWLRGESSRTEFERWWSDTVLGTAVEGLPVRLTVDARLQTMAGAALGSRSGAALVMNARTGEVLALVSHPAYDPNHLEEDWERLVSDPASPLLNRVTQGLYPLGGGWRPLIAAQAVSKGWWDGTDGICGADYRRLSSQNPDLIWSVTQGFRLREAPEFDLPSAYMAGIEENSAPSDSSGYPVLYVSPLQMALAASSFLGGGEAPHPRLISQYQNSLGDWQAPPDADRRLAMISSKAAFQLQAWLAEAAGSDPSGYLHWPVCGEKVDEPQWQISLDPAGDNPIVAVVLLEKKPYPSANLADTLLMLARILGN